MSKGGSKVGCVQIRLLGHPVRARAGARGVTRSEFFTPRERAAMACAEAVTLVAEGVSDVTFEEARRHFSEAELADLTWAVVAINGWNRLNVAFRTVPGSYRPHLRAQLEAQVTGSPARN